MNKTVLLLSPNGMLGTAVDKELSKSSKVELYKTTQWHYPEDDTKFGFRLNGSNKIEESYDYVINATGKIKPRILEGNNQSILDAIYTNSILPYKLVIDNPDSKIIQPLTDCEYKGDKGYYHENDLPDVGDIYGMSKALATKVKGNNFIGLKVSIIGFEKNSKRSLVEWFHNLLPGSVITGFTNHIWNGITTNAWAKIVRGIIENNIDISGIQHIAPSNVVTKYGLLNIFKEVFGRNDVVINKGEAKDSVNRALLTLYPQKNEELWAAAGYSKIPTIEELVQEMWEEYNG